MRRALVPIVMILFVTLLAAACQADQAAEEPEAEEPQAEETEAEETEAAAGDEETAAEDEVYELSFAASALPSSIGLLAAIIENEGLAEQHGLEIEFQEFAPDQAEQALLTGQVETGFFPIVSLANVRAEGEDIIFIRPLHTNHGSVLVREGDPYESLEDLVGETVATLNPVSGVYTSMQVLSAEVGLDWESDFDVISGPPPGLVTFLETGEVEAIVIFEPIVSSLLASGDYRSVMVPNQEWEERTGAPLLMLGLATRESWVEDNPEAARRLVALFDDLFSQIQGNPDMLREYQDDLELSDEAMDIAAEGMPEIYIAETAEEVQDNVDLILERSDELGIIDEVPDRVFWEFDD